ncbi:TPA: hypothetical protein ACXNC1_003584 [Proteus mirabilis]|uniref:hypothetical protein n=1 Tax=Proteus mirabilis TaxID=584 RepID=UPI0013D17C63|nr:hypothetical protein [Proteus mirabilis]MBG2863248.1 hypothetical protein [Proteus mirabilis]MBG3035697.1 hypothetical protein [Proteus mirabilis]
MSFKPIQKLAVTRTLSSGEQVAVGILAQNRQGVFFSVCRQLFAAVWQFISFYLACERASSSCT